MYFIIVKVCSSQAFILEKSASDCCGTGKEKNGRINEHGEGHRHIYIDCIRTMLRRANSPPSWEGKGWTVNKRKWTVELWWSWMKSTIAFTFLIYELRGVPNKVW